MQWGHAKIIKSENESQRSTDDMTTLSKEIQGRKIVTPFTVMKREKTTNSEADRQPISTCATAVKTEMGEYYPDSRYVH